MVLKRVLERPVGDIVHHDFSNMLLDKRLMKSFAGFCHVVVNWW